MKHGKKPTYEQRKLIQQWGLNPGDWLVSKDTPDQMLLVHKHTNQTQTIQKEGKNGR